MKLIIIFLLMMIGLYFPKVNAYFSCLDEDVSIVSFGENIIEIQDACVKNIGSVTCYIRVFSDVNLESDLNLEYWTLRQADGYYYYRNVLKPNQSTEPLFFSKVNDDYIFYAESIQSEGFNSYKEAFDE